MDQNTANQQQNSGFFAWIERVGNKLPHPVFIFIILAAIVILASGIADLSGLALDYTDPTGEEVTVAAESLLSVDGINYIFNSAVENFTSFAPLGTVLVAMLGVGIAEWTGLISSTLKNLLSDVPPFLLSAAVVFAGVISNIASDVGYVVIIPLGAVIFAGAGRHPIAGLAAAFAGVSAGFSANLLPGPTDALLVGITEEALDAANITYDIQVTANWYFIIASSFVLTIVGAIVTDKFVEPKLGEYNGEFVPDQEPLTDLEHRGLRNALIALIIYAIVMVYLMFDFNLPFSGILQSFDETAEAVNLNNFMSAGLLLAIFFLFAIPGTVYGVTINKIKDTKDWVTGMSEAMSSMGAYIVLAFFAAQLINYFNYTNLGTIIAVAGANFLESISLTGIPLILGFVLVAAFINLFIGSASAKWAILSPIFTPMFYNLNLTPEMTLMAYRIADSTTNIISPLMNYFAMVIVFTQRYDKDSGIGTLISSMLIYSITFLITWTILLIIWYLLGLPLGPNAPIAF